jgi:hypothetical protein
LAELEQRILQHFLADGKWRAESFEALLWLIEAPLAGFKFGVPELLEVYPRDIWGRPNPPSTKLKASWTTRVVGLGGYHLTFRWSWLMAEAVRIMAPENPELAWETLREIERMTSSEGAIGEIYAGDRNFRGALYQSELPFSWGSAKLLEAIASLPELS